MKHDEEWLKNEGCFIDPSAEETAREYLEHMFSKTANPWRALPVPDDIDGYSVIEISDGLGRPDHMIASTWKKDTLCCFPNSVVWRFVETPPTPEEIAAIYAEAG